MLILSRKIGESISLPGCGTTITVVGIYGRRVRLGITAPRDLAVRRSELLPRLEGKNAEQASGMLQTGRE